MPSRYPRTQSTDPDVKRKAGAGCSPSSTPMDADLQQRTSRGPKKLRDNGTSYMLTPAETRPPRPTPEIGYGSSTAASSSTAPTCGVHAIAPTFLGPGPSPAPSQRLGGPAPAIVPLCAIAPPTETPRVHPAQPNPETDTPTRNHTTSVLERTHIVWMFIGNTPSITRTSPTPPPSLHPPRRGSRFSSSPSHRHSPLGTPARQRPRRSPRQRDHDVESEQGYAGNSDSEDDTDNDNSIPGLMAGRNEVSSNVPDQTGPTVMAQDSPQDGAMLNLQVRRSRSEGEHAGPAGNLSPPLIALPSTPVGNPSHRRTLEDYDQTNARIRALNASLLADTRVQWQPRSHSSLSQLRTSASRSHSDRGVELGVRYLNVPGAAADALMATVRRRASRRHAAGTGIVDISDSESSQFESDDEDEELESESSSPLGTEAEAFEVETQTVSEARSTSDPPAFPCEPPEPAASSTATTLAELEDRVSVAGPCRGIAASTPQPEADGARVVDRRRVQPTHLPVSLTTDAPTGSTHPSPPDPKGKKRARDPDVDGGSWLDSARVEGLVREGKRRKVAPGACVSVTPLPSRPTSTTDTACRNPLDASGARLRD